MRGFMLKSLLPREGGGYRWRFAADVILEGAADIADWPEVLPRGSSDEGPLRYHGPVLVIRGELSPYVEPDRDMPSFLAIFPSVRLAGVRNARHWVHFDNKPEFVSLVRDFMA